MPMHLFVTGEKRVGKSTLLAKLLCGLEGGAGFCTVVLRGGVPPRRSVHLLDATRKEVPCQRNRLFFCGEGMDEAVVERFCRLGCAALAATWACILSDHGRVGAA